MSCVKGSVPTGNFAESRPTQRGFCFSEELGEIRARGNPKNFRADGAPPPDSTASHP
jgi:hypothetical protein